MAAPDPKPRSLRDLSDSQREMALLFLETTRREERLGGGPADPERYATLARKTGVPAAILERLERVELGQPEFEEPPVPASFADQVAAAAEGRPQPGEELVHRSAKMAPLFEPAPEMTAWIVKNFISRDGPLHSKSHSHLVWAAPAVLWTNVPNGKNPHRVAGTAEMPERTMKGNEWAKAQRAVQLSEWFGKVPTFLITLDAELWAKADDRRACAVVRHELLHCGQAIDADGFPRINEDTGMPVYTIRKHDVEVFVEEWADFGPASSAGASRALAEAAKGRPRVTDETIARACGTCRR